MLGANSQFYIQDVVWDTAVKKSAWLTTNTFVLRSVIMKDRKVDVFVPK